MRPIRPLALLLTLVLLAPVAGLAQTAPLKKVTLRLDWYPQAEHGGYFCALAEGLYQKAGLDVTILPGVPGDAVEPHVALGQYQFGLSNTDITLMARGRGLPLVAVMATMQHDPVAVLLHADSPVKTFADLEGRTIAVPPGAPWFLYVAKKYRLEHVHELPLTFETSSFINDPQHIQQCFVTSEPYFLSLKGVKVRTLLVMDSGCDPSRVIVTSDRFLASDPDAVQAFVTASRQGWRDYLVHPEATDAEIKRRNPEMTQALLDYSRQALIDGHFVAGFPERGEDVGLVSVPRFASQYHILRDIGILTQDFDYTKAVTTRFMGPPAATVSQP